MSGGKETSVAIREILNDLKGRLQGFYGKRLAAIILYGSHARGDAEEGSDVDVLVALKDCDDPISERDGLGDLLVELDLRYDTLISVVVVDAREFETRQTPFLMNVRREGVAV